MTWRSITSLRVKDSKIQNKMRSMMESKLIPGIRGFLSCIFATVCLAAIIAAAPAGIQEQKKDQPQLSRDEANAIDKILKANGVEAKMKAAADYAKKFPKEKAIKRQDVAGTIANEIYRVPDASQKIKLAEEYVKIFNQPEEADLVRPTLIEGYFGLNKFDQALDESAKYLEKNPDDVTIHVQIAWAGATQVQKQNLNPKLMQAAIQSSAKAVELMEADKKPAWMEDQKWKDYRNSWLWRLYYARSILLIQNNDKAGAKENAEKAVGIEPYDVGILLTLISLANEEYQTLAQQYQKEQKPEQLTKALEKMDEVIDWMARGVAACDGNPQLKTTQDQLMENLKQYYAFRFNGKTDGLQGLIEKYKKKA